jgi:hypothetical protein
MNSIVSRISGPRSREVDQAIHTHFQNLELQHHFWLGQILRGDDFLGQPGDVFRVANHRHVELLVDDLVARLAAATNAPLSARWQARIQEPSAVQRGLGLGLSVLT